jgi:diguanylate cyclase (GGDEF)-like protein
MARPSLGARARAQRSAAPNGPADNVAAPIPAVGQSDVSAISEAAQQALIADILASMEQGFVAFDRSARLIATNRRYHEVRELPRELCVPGRSLLDIARYCAVRGDYGPGEPETLALRHFLAASGAAGIYRATALTPSGRVLAVTSRPMPDGGFVSTFTDVTEARAIEAALRDSEARHRSLAAQLARQNEELELRQKQFDVALDNMSQGITFIDRDQKIVVCNRRHREIYGFSPDETRPGTSLADIYALRVQRGNAVIGMSPEAVAAHWQSLFRSTEPSDFISELCDGRTIAMHHEPLPGGGGWVMTHEDITERRRAEASLVFMARHDALTRLPNRMLFQERLEHAIELAARGTGCAVLCLDLDRFKLINDTLGHPVGDGLLRAAADRLQACARETDTVARLGGDEFAILQMGVERPEEAERLGNRIIAAFARPFEIDGHQIVIGTSVGVAVAPADGMSSAKLLKNADIALYLAKAEGRGTVRFFEPEMDARMQQRRRLELDLRNAIAREELELYYQPLVNLVTGKVSGLEALLRWQHPTRGLVLPMDFIPLAEETGMIVPIGEWVLRTACREARNWPPDISVAVNLSAFQFRKGNLVAIVRAAIRETGLPPCRLELEITESALLQDSAGVVATLGELRSMGIELALDDFGTGYSSLSYLRSFRFDKIKIDRSFVSGLLENRESLSIIQAVAGLSRSLGMKTTVEGVETLEQLAKLQGADCTEVQGYLFSPPTRARDLPLLFAKLDGGAGTEGACEAAGDFCDAAVARA